MVECSKAKMEANLLTNKRPMHTTIRSRGFLKCANTKTGGEHKGLPPTTHQVDSSENSIMACHDCDLLVGVPDLESGEKAHCPRCGCLLAVNRPHAHTKMFAWSLAALAFLVLANIFPFIGLESSGQERTVTLVQSIGVLFEKDYPFLSAIVFVAIVGLPAALLIGIVYASVAIRADEALPGARRALRWVLTLAPWSMAEIFLIGILVSFVKIVSLADVSLGVSFWAYALFTVCSLLSLMYIDRRDIWRHLDSARRG